MDFTPPTDPQAPNIEPSPDQPDPAAKADKERVKEIWKQVEACKKYRRKLASKWDKNIDYRSGKPFATSSDSDRINVNIDWTVTKAKQSALFSKLPQIRVNHPPQTFTLPWVHGFEQRINDTLALAGIESVMEEILPDCINAAGFGAAIVSREVLTDFTEIPAIDISFFSPEEQAQITETKTLPDGSPLPTTQIPRVLDQRYIITRISPKDFLWPVDFDASDFDRAPWLGRSGKMSWAEAKKRFNLKDEEKSTYVSNQVTDTEGPQRDPDKDQANVNNNVQFDEIFYKEFQYDTDATSYTGIHHLIFLANEKKPILNETWQGQQTKDGTVIGCLKFPIRVLTLTYMSDEAIPPSDSAIIRPQVDELNALRTQAILQRKHSLPVRWIDVNRIDPAIQMALMRGVWQHMIPVQGGGANAIGEVQRSAMPPENASFDKNVRADIQDLMQLGPAPNVETAEQPGIESMSATRLTKERARVSKFVADVAETIGGLLCLYEDPNSLGQGFDPAFSRTLSYSIVADSTVLMDTTQRLQLLFQFINFTAKSGWVNIEAVLKEIATLSGLDPNIVIQKPEPRPPAEPNISLRLTGTEDLLSPMALATLVKSGQAPTEQHIEQAKHLIEVSVVPTSTSQINPLLLSMMIKSGQVPPNMLPSATPNDGSPQPPMPPIPEPPPMGVGDANPNWSTMNKVNKRSDDEEQ